MLGGKQMSSRVKNLMFGGESRRNFIRRANKFCPGGRYSTVLDDMCKVMKTSLGKRFDLQLHNTSN